MNFDIVGMVSSAASWLISTFEKYWVAILIGLFVLSMFVAYMIFIKGKGGI